MKIRDVQIDGFGVWSGLSVHSMPDSMTVFYGPNEAGKTTLMNFLRTMFYGFTPDRRGRYLPPLYPGKPGGTIRVTGPGGGYEITRRGQLDQGAATGHLTVTGSDGLAQGQHRLAMLLGQVDESIFTNVFAIGLRELQELSTLDDTAAADELYKLSSGLDRVSLVDVTRQLKAARQKIVGATPDTGQMQQLMLQREKLKEEVEQLNALGRRWSELASLRNTQNSELDELKQRIGQWEVEAKAYEVGLQVRPAWHKRTEVQAQIDSLGARTDIPQSAADKLAELSLQIAEREERLNETKQKRKALRDQARSLPLRRGILGLAAKIEAANEQAPWISSIQKNIQRLEGQLSQTRDQLLEDAKRLGITEEDQQALLQDRRMARMPDLSRQAINQLAEPASEVRMWTTRFKQAKEQSEVEKKEADRLEKEIAAAMETTKFKDLKTALESNGELIALLRKRQQIEEALERLTTRREQLEEEAIDLTVDEALPLERSFMLSALFVGGAFFLIWGLGMLLPLFSSIVDYNPSTGSVMAVLGGAALFFGLMWSNVLERSTVSTLEDVEDQIDAVRKEIRKTELERDDLQRRIPSHSGTLEIQLRESEAEVTALEALLPVQHNFQAVVERYKTAKKRAGQASDALRTARSHWQRTLQQLGLSESMSPKSIRVLAEGYDSLLQTRKHLQSLEQELEARQLELGALTQRIDSLAKQVFAAKAASDAVSKRESDDEEEFDEQSSRPASSQFKKQGNSPKDSDREPVRADGEAATAALNQLSKLSALISSQEQYILQKRALKEQDQALAKTFSSIQKGIDKLHRSHSAVLAEHGCESEEQLHEMLELKEQHRKLVEQLNEFGERILAIIGGVVPYETVAKLLEGPGAADLEKRWEQISQRTQQAEQRVEQLHLRQGELSQEMKSLAANTRLSEAKLELVCIENQLKACGEHWQTLAATTGLLDRVCEVYETERQPETLREASAFLSQLTEGKYVRIWTPLGKNQLRIDNGAGQALPLEVLSRGTREAVFISLRLSLAAAYARRGVTIPLVLDDVLVNFDSIRAESAAKVLRDFAELGHQVVMFTCHEHIMRIFDRIGVQVRVLPTQGQPGEAEIFYDAQLTLPEPEPEPELELEPEPTPKAVPRVEVLAAPQPVAPQPEPPPKPVVKLPVIEVPAPPVAVEPVPLPPPPPPQETPVASPVKKVRRVVVVEQEPEIDWLWYERHSTPTISAEGWVESDAHGDDGPLPPDLWWTRHGKQVNS
ncbi:AAA family ATPase [Aureliella helgolandensis]|uniref:YhaN AAA domain-containing protein n=1 Tax=Aureliella helgolandensis TaxID=2527968 RepID=A0A518G6Y1_9BACT|nr:AAA family ATPase [Aureliella helgolandensis]QDV24335.1 hypothetical protein Q31a_26510 [Aureliella helgolandensis]